MPNIEQTCSCQIDSSNFLNSQFRCFAESQQIVTFRTQLLGTTAIGTRDLLSEIEMWTGSPQQFVLGGVQLTLNTTCPLLLASFEEDECPGVPTSATDPLASPTGLSGTLIASVILGVLLLTSLVCNVLLIAFVTMSRRKKAYDFRERDSAMPNAYNEHRRRRYVV